MTLDYNRKDKAMIRVVDIAQAIDMSRVERNQAIYSEDKTESSRKGAGIAGRLLIAVGTIFMVVVVAACLSLVIPKLAGYDTYVVVSGSMEPSIPVGSIVYSEPVDPELLRAGDVIVFSDKTRSEAPITHRVVSNNPFTGTIITKGDANANRDTNPVSYDNVIGSVKTHVPRVGFTAAMFTSPLGKLVAGLFMLEAWLLIEVGRRLKKRDATQKRDMS